MQDWTSRYFRIFICFEYTENIHKETFLVCLSNKTKSENFLEVSPYTTIYTFPEVSCVLLLKSQKQFAKACFLIEYMK